MDTQLHEAKDAIDLLANSSKMAGSIKSKFVRVYSIFVYRLLIRFDEINQLCTECNQLIDDTEMIRTVDTVRTNLLTTLIEVHRYIGIPQKVRYYIARMKDFNLFSFAKDRRNQGVDAG